MTDETRGDSGRGWFLCVLSDIGNCRALTAASCFSLLILAILFSRLAGGAPPASGSGSAAAAVSVAVASASFPPTLAFMLACFLIAAVGEGQGSECDREWGRGGCLGGGITTQIMLKIKFLTFQPGLSGSYLIVYVQRSAQLP